MKTAFQQVLVHIDASPACNARIRIANQIAQQCGAALHALYAAASSMVSMPYPDPAAAELLARMLQEDVAKRGRTHMAFDALATEIGMNATWGEVTDDPVMAAFAQQSLFADLLVLGQHDPAHDATHDVPADFAQTILAASGKPGLIVPYTGDFRPLGGTVVIAWKDTREAARAVAAAIPLLQRAQRVHVLAWGSQESTVGGVKLDLDTYLQRRGVQAQWHRDGPEPDRMGELLLSRACDLSADLLVMGCYGHSRAREWLLGGTSRTVLRSMTLPVLMSH